MHAKTSYQRYTSGLACSRVGEAVSYDVPLPRCIRGVFFKILSTVKLERKRIERERKR
jgi:hypothetical protein